METIYLSLCAQEAVSTFFVKSPVYIFLCTPSNYPPYLKSYGIITDVKLKVQDINNTNTAFSAQITSTHI